MAPKVSAKAKAEAQKDAVAQAAAKAQAKKVADEVAKDKRSRQALLVTSVLKNAKGGSADHMSFLEKYRALDRFDSAKTDMLDKWEKDWLQIVSEYCLRVLVLLFAPSIKVAFDPGQELQVDP